jgi:hypothetical protein
MIALWAGWPVPPSLVDTSYARIRSGYLTAEDLQAKIERDPPAAIFWSGRFQAVTGFRSWVERRFRLRRSFDDAGDLLVPRT